ncbi:MAG: sulfite exporter TauE/SafE family protein [Elusimicrobia bacterium]|nr:sulfite exporter TauE/SafE family protein [Elusimicrobiota bacterium]
MMIDPSLGFGAALIAGLISFISPCVLPLIPVFMTYLTGISFEDLTESKGPGIAPGIPLFHVLAFVTGFSTVFILLGASATSLGRILFSYQEWFARVGGAVVALFGLFMTGMIPLAFLQKDLRVHLRRKPAGLLGSFIVGGTFAFGWTPCVGPVLGSILLLASEAESVGQGMLLLSFYSLGLAVPFILSALLFNWFIRLFRKMGPLLIWVERAAGAVLVAVGILVATGQFSRFTSWILVVSEPWVDWLAKKGI